MVCNEFDWIFLLKVEWRFFSEFNTQRKTTVKTVSEGGRRWLWKHRIPGIPGELLQINLFSPIWFLFTPLLISIFWSYGKISFFIPLFYFSKYPSNTLQHPSNTLKTTFNTLQTHFKIIFFSHEKWQKNLWSDFTKNPFLLLQNWWLP